MRRLLNFATGWLWLLVATVFVLLGGKTIGVHWSLSPKVAFGRLLANPAIAGMEVLLAVMLLVLAWIHDKRKKWMVIFVGVAAIACAIYHVWYYFIGIEFLLMYGAGYLVRESVKDDG